MHEAAVAQNLIGIIRAEMAAHGARRLLRARVRCGWLSTVVPEALAFAFEAMTRGGDLEGAVLDIEEVPALLRCGACGREFTPQSRDTLLAPCPGCGEDIGHRVLDGRDLILDRIEAE